MQKRKVNQHARLQNNWLLAGGERGFVIDGSESLTVVWTVGCNLLISMITASRYGVFELTFVKSVVDFDHKISKCTGQ